MKLWVACPDGVLRAINAKIESKKLSSTYFGEQSHISLPLFLEHVKTNKEKEWGDELGVKLAVMTHTNIHSNISSLISPIFPRNIHQVRSISIIYLFNNYLFYYSYYVINYCVGIQTGNIHVREATYK